MNKSEILKLSPREFTNRVFTAFRDKKITAIQMKSLCEYYNKNNGGGNEQGFAPRGVQKSIPDVR